MMELVAAQPWLVLLLGALSAAALQQALQARGLMTHDMATSSRPLAAALLVLAGLVQLSPLKRACLEKCNAPIAPERPFQSGLSASMVSIGSCGVLMLVLFATGVMSVPAMAVLTGLLLLEHWLPRGTPATALSGYALLAAGGLRLITGGNA